MSEIEGYVLVYSHDAKVLDEMASEFSKENTIKIKDDEYQVWDAKADGVLDLHFYASEYADTAQLSQYFLKKYSPDILISSFDAKALVDGKRVVKRKAFSALSALSPRVGFYVNVEYGRYEKAYEILCDGGVDLEGVFSGVPNFERCFRGDFAPLMEYAVDRGFHNHSCHYDADSCFDERGVHVLHRLVFASDLGLIEKALKLGATANGIDRDSETLLHHVGRYAFSDEFDFEVLELIDLLAAHGADFNAKDWRGSGPLLSLYTEVEDHIEEHEKEVVDIIEALVGHGASVDVFDGSGAGLLTYYSGVGEVETIFLKANPALKPYTEDFDIHSFVLDRSYLDDDDLPDYYDQYFCKCVELGFIDFMFQEGRVSILQSFGIPELSSLLVEVSKSPNAAGILEEFLAHGLPVFIEQDIEGDAAEDQGVEIFHYEDNTELVDFYRRIKLEKHKKIVAFYSESGEYFNSQEIVGVN